MLQIIPVMPRTCPQIRPKTQYSRITIPSGHTAFATVSKSAGERDIARRKRREAVEMRLQKQQVNLDAGWSFS